MPPNKLFDTPFLPSFPPALLLLLPHSHRAATSPPSRPAQCGCLWGPRQEAMMENFLLQVLHHRLQLALPQRPPCCAQECMMDNDCQKDQFCFKSPLASWCQKCKAKDMTCQKDGECCLGYLCVWGKCAEGVRSGESGTRCDPRQDECAPGLCCTTSNSLPFPVCVPYPKEGDPCQVPSRPLLGLLGWGNLAAFAKRGRHCACAPGLKCRIKRYSTLSTCEKPEGSMDMGSLGQQLPFFQPVLMRRDKDGAYYDDSGQEGQLAIVNLPRGLYSMEDIGQTKMLSDDYDEKKQLPWKDVEDPNPSDFQELKQLANQMGQYFGPGFY